MVRRLGLAPSSTDYRSVALLLSYRRVAESGGLAPQPAGPVQLLSKQRPHLGGFTLRKVAESSGPAPQARRPEPVSDRPPRSAALLSKWRRREVTLPSGAGPPGPLQTVAGTLVRFRLRKVSAAGFAPASIRLEGGGLSFSATRRKSWTSRRDSHPQHGVRSTA